MEKSSEGEGANGGGIYDELDQLVDLMTKDKAAMSTKISQLEECVSGLQRHKDLLEAANATLRQKNYKLHQELTSQQEQARQIIDGLEGTLVQARREIHRGKAEEMDYIKQLEEQKDAEIRGLKSSLQEKEEEVEELQHEREHSNAMLDELHKKVDKTKSDMCDMAASMQLQKSQNTKISHQLSDMRKHCETLKSERDGLTASLDKLQQKLESAENTILVLRGRASNAKKSEDQLKAKCAALQAALEAATARAPSVVRVSPGPKRTREELKLREECRKKDDVIESCSTELKTCKAEMMRQSLRISQMSRQMESHKRNSDCLSRELEELRMLKEVEVKELKQKVRKYTKELKDSMVREREFDTGKEVVEKSLSRIDRELKEAKGEIQSLKQEVASREEKSEQHGHLCWEDETVRLAKNTPLGRRASMKEENFSFMSEQSRELKEAKGNYERLKKVCTRRCTELAAEVWRLKQMLHERQDPQISFNSSDSKYSITSPSGY